MVGRVLKVLCVILLTAFSSLLLHKEVGTYYILFPLLLGGFELFPVFDICYVIAKTERQGLFLKQFAQ